MNKRKIKWINTVSVLLIISATVLFILSFSRADITRPKFLYWLQDIEIEKIPKGKYKYVVIDYSSDGGPDTEFSREQIADLKRRLTPDGIVLAYVNIGEAEDYRYYWKEEWKPAPSQPEWKGRPAFLGPENKNWPGNYIVDYRNPHWKKIVLGYIDKVIDQGFDGVYLDRVDTYYTLSRPPYNINKARAEMIDFVGEISGYSQNRKPGFKIYVQNAEELGRMKDSNEINLRYLEYIDGIGKESAFYSPRRRRSFNEIYNTVNLLNIFKEQGKTVLTVDYPPLHLEHEVKWVHKKARLYGYIEYCAVRELDRIVKQPEMD